MLLHSDGIMKNVGEIIRTFCVGCILGDVPFISGCDYILQASCQMWQKLFMVFLCVGCLLIRCTDVFCMGLNSRR
jgi:hypothetical protein